MIDRPPLLDLMKIIFPCCITGMLLPLDTTGLMLDLGTLSAYAINGTILCPENAPYCRWGATGICCQALQINLHQCAVSFYIRECFHPLCLQDSGVLHRLM